MKTVEFKNEKLGQEVLNGATTYVIENKGITLDTGITVEYTDGRTLNADVRRLNKFGLTQVENFIVETKKEDVSSRTKNTVDRYVFTKNTDELAEFISEITNIKTLAEIPYAADTEMPSVTYIKIGTKTFSVTYGETFIRLGRGDMKIQLAYTSKKNTLRRLNTRIMNIVNA